MKKTFLFVDLLLFWSTSHKTNSEISGISKIKSFINLLLQKSLIKKYNYE